MDNSISPPAGSNPVPGSGWGDSSGWWNGKGLDGSRQIDPNVGIGQSDSSGWRNGSGRSDSRQETNPTFGNGWGDLSSRWTKTGSLTEMNRRPLAQSRPSSDPTFSDLKILGELVTKGTVSFWKPPPVASGPKIQPAVKSGKKK
jgi:hypothetical protein